MTVEVLPQKSNLSISGVAGRWLKQWEDWIHIWHSASQPTRQWGPTNESLEL